MFEGGKDINKFFTVSYDDGLEQDKKTKYENLRMLDQKDIDEAIAKDIQKLSDTKRIGSWVCLSRWNDFQ